MIEMDFPAWIGWVAMLIGLLALDLLVLGGGSALAWTLAIMAGAGALAAYLGAKLDQQLIAVLLSAFVIWPSITYLMSRFTGSSNSSFDKQWERSQIFVLFADDSGTLRLKLHADTFPARSIDGAPLEEAMRVRLIRFEGIQAVVKPA